jgi:hypothetical protein
MHLLHAPGKTDRTHLGVLEPPRRILRQLTFRRPCTSLDVVASGAAIVTMSSLS